MSLPMHHPAVAHADALLIPVLCEETHSFLVGTLNPMSCICTCGRYGGLVLQPR